MKYDISLCIFCDIDICFIILHVNAFDCYSFHDILLGQLLEMYISMKRQFILQYHGAK